MKKFIYTIFLIFILFTVSSCSQDVINPYEVLDSTEQTGIGYPIFNPVFPQNYTEGNMYNDVLEYEDNEVYFRVIHLYLPDIYTEGDDFKGISWYAFQIITSDEYEISFTCDDSYYIIETQNGGYNNISDNVLLSYEESSDITVTLKYSDEVLYTSSFEYISSIDQINQDDYQVYEKDEFLYINLGYIALIAIVLFIVSIIIYRKYYKNIVNKSLKSNKSVKLLDLNKFVIVAGTILALLSVISGIVWKNSFENKEFNNISLSRTIVIMDGTTLDDLNIDLNTLTLDEVEVKTVDGELVTYPQHNTSYIIDIEYSLIQDDVVSILEANTEQGLCGGDSSLSNFCVLYGPFPAINLTLSNEDFRVVIKVVKSISTYFGESTGILIEIYYPDGVYYLNYPSSDIDQEILNIWNAINAEFLYLYENDLLE